jgi:RNA:NAD 2'-phosphotransferase (TPT1/KptA family)
MRGVTILLHGTTAENLPTILRYGLSPPPDPGRRLRHVYLAPNTPEGREIAEPFMTMQAVKKRRLRGTGEREAMGVLLHIDTTDLLLARLDRWERNETEIYVTLNVPASRIVRREFVPLKLPKYGGLRDNALAFFSIAQPAEPDDDEPLSFSVLFPSSAAEAAQAP